MTEEKKETPSDCCALMKQALDYADKATPTRPISGIQVAHVFNKTTGKHTWSPVVYVLPARGRGKARSSQVTMLVEYCPFCGKKQKGKPDNG